MCHPLGSRGNYRSYMGIFSKIGNAFKKTKAAIDNKIVAIFSGGELDDEFYEELEMVLLSSDVGAATTDIIIEKLRARASKQKLRNEDDVKQALRDIMAEILSESEPPVDEYPLVIMVVGVNGVGKTTTIGKLAKYYTNLGKSVLLVAADTFRAAASDQLSGWATRAGVRIVKHAEGADPASVVYDGLQSARAKGNDVVIIDTAGRLHNKVNLMEELKKVNRVAEKELNGASYQKLIVLDATTGQNAISQVEYFDDAIGLTGLVLTKLDGTAKGGVVLAVVSENSIPIKFIGTGEGLDDLELFNAKEFAEAII